MSWVRPGRHNGSVSDEVIWLRPQRPTRGPRPGKSRDEIVAVAVEIADSDGIEAVSMRRVAVAVGLGTMSLYRYVPTKLDLIDLMLDAVSGEYELPSEPSGDWEADLRGLARQEREIMRRHPWAPHVVITRPSLSPNALRYMEFCLAALRPAGLDPGADLEIVGVLNGGVASYVANEIEQERRGLRAGADQQAAANARYLRGIIDNGEHPLFSRAITEAGPAPDADARFERLLDRLFNGLVSGG